MPTLKRCIERGCELHPIQCYKTGFAPSPPDSPPAACVIGAAHAGYADLTGRRHIRPQFFEVKGTVLSAAREIGDNAHPLNIELRTRQLGGTHLQDRMAILNDNQHWDRERIAAYVHDKIGPIHVRHDR